MQTLSNPPLQPEAWTYLINAARAQLTGDPPASLPAACTDVNELRQLADRHRMLPILVAKTSPQELPPGFQQRAYGLAAYGNSLVQELHRLREWFDDADIRWFTYKGPILSMDLYGDPLLRPCDDLDLLVHPDDLQKAIHILSREHYVLQQDLPPAAMKDQGSATLMRSLLSQPAGSQGHIPERLSGIGRRRTFQFDV